MNPIQAARELGKAIQADDRFKAYFTAKEKNDGDEALQNLIGEFNLQRENLSMELSKAEGEKKQGKIDELNEKMRGTYAEIMSNENMRAYSGAKAEFDQMLNGVNQIVAMCCEGADPETCEPAAKGCGSGCGSCGGCGG
ncbi:MAG: YlbF family regulator [Oscillospiraceae bacterium]|nr:YlbF family regulator [Oscillospiraceae bacterium]